MNRFLEYLRIPKQMGIRGIIKTLYINFRMLPFSQAIQMPIYCTAYTKFYDLSGKITFECPVRHGLVKIGFWAHNMFVPKNNITLLTLTGEFRVGGRIVIAPGVSIWIGRYGVLRMDNEIFINARARIVCLERIDIGQWVRIAWETQLFDTNFHYIKELSTGKIPGKYKPIRIGSYVWIGNRTTIGSGTVIPDYCIIASNSLCTKDYSEIPQDSIIGGIPAKLLKSGYRRLFNETEITKTFGRETD